MMWMICIVGAYLIGAIPFGVLIAATRGIDIRQHGSKNIGATNVGRVLGKKLGLLCFILDTTKGVAPVLIAGIVCETINRNAASLSPLDMWLWMAVAVAAVLGHMYSPFIGFGGGKGIATSFGAMTAMWPLLTFPALGALIVWYLSLRTFRYVSLAGVIAAMSIPALFVLAMIPPDVMSFADAYQSIQHAHPPLLTTFGLALLVLYKHRGNLARIRSGEEPKVSGWTRRGGMNRSDSEEA